MRVAVIVRDKELGLSIVALETTKPWALRLERKLGHNKAAVALANKLARITWAVWRHDRNFEPLPELHAASQILEEPP